jgi:LysM repeat protein
VVKETESAVTPVDKQETKVQPAESTETTRSSAKSWVTVLSWIGTLLVVAVLLSVLFQFNPFKKAVEQAEPVQVVENNPVDLPEIATGKVDYALVRSVEPDTILPEGTRHFAIRYTVEEGDTIFGIAHKFNLEAESILYANYDLLNDDPTYLSPGWVLTIPPTDGVYYKWKEGDTLEKVAEKYYVNVNDIIQWPSNQLDVTQPSTKGLEYVMIPGGYRPIQSWIVPIPYTSGSGATREIAGPGGCASTGYAYIGSGSFIFPTAQTGLSGFDFSSYHLAIDLSAATGDPIYASDYGTVVYAGWNDSGYGNLVVIDHGNGYETLYAHLSQVYVSCGQGVVQGAVIGAAGDTGRSYGSHLHFEVRLNGGFVNPWSVLGY